MPLLLKMHFRPRMRLRHFARWNTNPFKLEALDGFDPHTLPPSLPAAPPSPSKLKTSRGIHNAAITFITSTFTTQTCSLLSLPPSGHVGVHQNGLTRSRRSYSAVPASSCPPPPPPRWEVWDCAVSPGSFSSTPSYLMVFEDASGFLPPVLPTFLHAGAIFNRYIPYRPFSERQPAVEEHIVFAARLQSIPQWYFVGGFPQMQLFLFFFFPLL